MGMFDTIIINKKCKVCNKPIRSAQTKATACMMDTYNIGDPVMFENVKVENGSIEIHGYCGSCLTWYDGEISIKHGLLQDKIKLVFHEKIGEYKDNGTIKSRRK